MPWNFSSLPDPNTRIRARARTRTHAAVCLEALALVLHLDQEGTTKTMSEAVREMQFDSSLPRYRRGRSVKRKKLGELYIETWRTVEL